MDKKCDAKLSNSQAQINEIKAGGGSGASTTASEVGSNKTSFSPPAKKANQQFVESRRSRHFGQPVQALCPSVIWMCSSGISSANLKLLINIWLSSLMCSVTMRKGGYNCCTCINFKLAKDVENDDAYRLKSAIESSIASDCSKGSYRWLRDA